MARPVLIDTDPGVDDALALFLAASSPELDVVAVTTVAGNVGVDLATENARRVVPLAWEGRPAPPIHRGACGGEETAEHVHGIDGLGGAGSRLNDRREPLYPPTAPLAEGSAVDAMLRAAEIHGERLTLVTLGPLTNLAAALRAAPERMRRVGEVVVMGGVFREAGNVTAVAEFNIFVDPEAAQVVCDSGLNLRWIPLDVTHRCLLRRSDLLEMTDTRRCRFMRDALEWYMDHHQQGFGERAAFLHDPVAVGAVLWPELLELEAHRVDVETTGRLTRGMTLADFRPAGHRQEPRVPNARVALRVDAPEMVRRVLSRLGA